MSKISDRVLRRHLYNEVKKLDLVDFICKVSGTDFSQSGTSQKCICPLPSHKDSAPSFFVTRGHDGVWIFHCFGCGSCGTIIDFCKDFFSLDHSSEALLVILEKSGMDTGQDMLINAIKQARITIDMDKKLECSHFVAANNCRRFLRSRIGDEDAQKWVAKAYRKMNECLDNSDSHGIESIGDEAIRMAAGVTKL